MQKVADQSRQQSFTAREQVSTAGSAESKASHQILACIAEHTCIEAARTLFPQQSCDSQLQTMHCPSGNCQGI